MIGGHGGRVKRNLAPEQIFFRACRAAWSVVECYRGGWSGALSQARFANHALRSAGPAAALNLGGRRCPRHGSQAARATERTSANYHVAAALGCATDDLRTDARGPFV